MFRISVVVPVFRPQLFYNMIDSVYSNTTLPNKIVVVNNSSEALTIKSKRHVHIELHDFGKNIYPYAAWEIGRHRANKCDAVLFINDDILLASNFFERITHTFQKYPTAGVISPKTEIEMSLFHNYKPQDSIEEVKRREGWAFTIRKPLLDQISPIPSDLKLFYGDNYFWHWTYFLLYKWYRDLGTVCFHHVGASVKTTKNKKEFMEREKQICTDALQAQKVSGKRRGEK